MVLIDVKLELPAEDDEEEEDEADVAREIASTF